MEHKHKVIYLDNAATTKTDERVLKKMLPYFTEQYGNPMAVYTFAQEAKGAIEESREKIAAVIGSRPNEIYFTSGGSEGDNWALKATAEALKEKGNHIITGKTEHHAILNTCAYLERHGFEITYLDVDEKGFVSPDDVKNAITDKTILISIMSANNEIGTIAPVAEIGRIAHENDVLFHTDAVQAFGHIPLNVDEMNIDMLSASGHKFYGPKGIGFMYIRNNVQIGAFIHGGAQERNRRAGTSNVPGIVGMGEAARLAAEEMEENAARETALRDRLIDRVMNGIKGAHLNGDPKKRLPNNVNFSFDYTEGESLLIMLDQRGICGSSGSACTSGSLDPSHVLTAIGLGSDLAHGSIRLTLSHETTEEEIDETYEQLKKIVERLRKLSPFNPENMM